MSNFVNLCYFPHEDAALGAADHKRLFCLIPNGEGLASRQRTILVHNGVMPTANKIVRQSVSLPASVAAQVRRLAKARRLSSNRMLLELIENGMETEKRKQQEFFDLAERFRSATEPEEVKRLGDQMGRMVFGG
jgi:hypothetical protein